jgi:hypothetical protein
MSGAAQAVVKRSMAVVGAGQMGTGIGIVAARSKVVDPNSGGRIYMIDPVPGSLDRSRAFVDKWMAKERKKERLSDEDGEHMLKSLAFAEQPGSPAEGGTGERRKNIGKSGEKFNGNEVTLKLISMAITLFLLIKVRKHFI